MILLKLKFCNNSLKPIIVLSQILIALSNCVAPDQVPPAASHQAYATQALVEKFIMTPDGCFGAIEAHCTE